MGHGRVLRTLMLSNFTMALGFNIWMATFNNFAVEVLKVSPAQMGIIQSVREIPGLLGFGIGFLALSFSELSLASLSVVLMGFGLALIALSGDATTLLIYTFVFSIGFHLYNPAASAVALLASEGKETPRLLGRLGSIGAAAAVLATLFILVGLGPLGFRWILVAAGAVTVLGGVYCVSCGRGAQTRPERQRVIWRGRYWIFYTLTFLMGSRRHIFSTFAIFLLVHDYGINVRVTAILFLTTSLLATQTARWQGRLVAHFGEKPMLTIYFLLISLVCVGYAYVGYLPFLYILFVSDSILAGFDIAVNTYLRRIAPPSEVTANTSMSQTINHVSALFVPAIGGAMWEHYGSQSTFLFGAIVALACLLVTRWMKTAAPAPIRAVASE